MSTEADNQRILAALPDLNPDILRHARHEWTPQNTMRQVLNVEAKRLREVVRTSLESCTAAELADLQGQIKGIQSMLGATNAQGNL